MPAPALSASADAAAAADDTPVWSSGPCPSTSSTLEAAIAAVAPSTACSLYRARRYSKARQLQGTVTGAARPKECVAAPRLAAQPDRP